jgi:hypothetical protein
VGSGEAFDETLDAFATVTHGEPADGTGERDLAAASTGQLR